MLPEKLGPLIHHCAKTKAYRYGQSLHGAATKTGLHSDVYIANHILSFYAKCDRIDFSRHLFDEMSQRNLITWSALISGYDQSQKPHSALEVFAQMLQDFKPNEFVFSSALSSCSSIKSLELGKQIHSQALKLGHASVSFVLNSLISMYMKCGMCVDASMIFWCGESANLTLVSYNVAITGLVENEQQESGIDVFKVMRRRGLVPDCFTFAALLGPDEPVYDILLGMQLHCLMVKLGYDSKAFPGNVLISLYSKFNSIEESEKVFRLIEERDDISWNTVIAACCRCEDNVKALNIFREMVNEQYLRPDNFVYSSVLSAAADLASIRHGKEIHAILIRTKPDWDVGVGNALINMYAKSGCISTACAIFQQMKIHNLVSWNTMIAAFANHGLGRKAIELFEDMKRKSFKPDSVTFLGLMTACNHSGLANEGQAVFNSMNYVYGISPDIEHFCCLVDLLGRSGKVNEAEEYMRKYKIGEDAVILGSLLSACRLHGSIIYGEQIAKRLLELNPVSSSPYVLLSNLYASDRKWDGVAGARKLLHGSGLKKEAAYSSIEVKGSVEKFIVGDFSHSRMDEILNLLKTLSSMKDDELLWYRFNSSMKDTVL